MIFEDALLVRAADPTTRSEVLDATACRHVLEATYDTSSLDLEGPYSAVIDDLPHGSPALPTARVDGGWSQLGDPQRVTLRLDLTWPFVASLPRPDAVWLGSVVARTRPVAAPIEAVTATWPDPHIPPDPARPDTVSGRVRVRYAAVPDSPAAARPFPVTVAVLVRSSLAGLSGLLADSASIQRDLEPGLGRSATRELPVRHPVVVAWVVPQEVLDDPDWPGASAGASPSAAREARRDAASQWLAPLGIALVPIPPATP